VPGNVRELTKSHISVLKINCQEICPLFTCSLGLYQCLVGCYRPCSALLKDFLLIVNTVGVMLIAYW